MAVNSYLIGEKIKYCFYKQFHECSAECKIRYATIYNPLIKMKSNTAYIVIDSNTFPKNEENSEDRCLLIVMGELTKEQLKQTKHDIICVNKEVGLGKVYENLLSIIEYYNTWEEKLSSALIKGATLDDICRISVPYFGNPLTVQTANFELIGVGETEEIKYPYKFREGDSDFLSERWVMSALKTKKNIFNPKQPFEFYYIEEHSSLLMNIFFNDQYTAQVCVDANHRKIVKEDYIRICIFSNYVRQYMKYNPSVAHITKKRFSDQVKEYVTGMNNKERLMISLLKRNWNTDDYYVCIALNNKNSVEDLISEEHFCHKCEERLRECVGFLKDGHIYILLNLRTKSTISQDMMKQINIISKEFGYDVGISFVFDNFFSCRNYFKQAEAVIKMKGNHNKTDNVYLFSDYKLRYIMKYGIESLSLSTLIPRGLKKLLKYDEENHSDFCATLQVYLKNNRNVTDTVNELFIHRSTFKYRLQRIKEIMQIDIDNFEEQMYLEMLLLQLEEDYNYAYC